MPIYEIAIRLGIALVCGGILGFDRERRGYAAGLRTHMLVSLGSAGFALVGVLSALEMNTNYPDAPPVDPTRIIAAVVGGIGFLCAGVIIQSRGRVRGLTTATGVWTVAAIGAAAGMGFYYLVAFTTVLGYLTLSFLKRLEPDITNSNGDNNGADEHGEENEERSVWKANTSE